MSIISDTYNIFKDFAEKERVTTMARKVRILKVVLCILVIVRAFLSYYNFFELIKFPAFPMFEESVRSDLKHFAIAAIIVIIIRPIFENTVIHRISECKKNPEERSFWVMKAFTAESVFEALFVIILISYTTMTFVDYVNGIDDFPKWPFYVAVFYLAIIITQKASWCDLQIWRKNYIKYTPNCDMNGNRIPCDCYVFYRGRRYKVEKGEKFEYFIRDEYSTSNRDERILLDVAAADSDGKLQIDSSSAYKSMF